MSLPTTTGTDANPFCGWCSNGINRVIHFGPCPHIKAIEHHPNGNIRRLEFRDESEGFENMNDFIDTLPTTKEEEK